VAAKKVKKRNRILLPKDPRIEKIVADYLDKLHYSPAKDSDRVPGVAVAVRWNQTIVHLSCHGYANLETGAKITPDTVFDLGSLSKQFTAAAAYNLIIHNQLDLNDRLSKFFREFPPWADDITVEDLLHHTSALPEYVEIFEELRPAEKGFYEKALKKPDHWYPTMPNRKRKEISNQDVLKWLATRKELPAPDTEYHYSNSGYVVLAELVARAAKEPFAKYVMEAVIFGIDEEMSSTYVFDGVYGLSPDDPKTANHARCYNRVGRRFVPVGYTPLNFINGDGNVHSSIRDLAKWEQFLHSLDYNLAARDLLWSPVLIKNRKRVNYGAGWNLLREKYEDQVKVNGKQVTRKYEMRAEYHRGEWLGWRSYIARASKWAIPATGKQVDPKTRESLGIVVLSNADFGDKHFTTCRIAQEISQVYLGQWKKDNIMNNFNCG
jgi:CubicO group peptidase (beta-lactamase class C family)